MQDRLHAAHAEGLITLAEFDIRVGEAWQAKTRGDLAKITADLPAPQPAPRPAPPPVPRRKRGPTALRVLTTIWLSILAANLVVWGIIQATNSADIYPWWLWIAGPPGAVLGVLWWMLGPGRGKGDDKRTALE